MKIGLTLPQSAHFRFERRYPRRGGFGSRLGVPTRLFDRLAANICVARARFCPSEIFVDSGALAIERNARLLPGFDEKLREQLARAFLKRLRDSACLDAHPNARADCFPERVDVSRDVSGTTDLRQIPHCRD